MLANRPAGFSIGEAYAFFRPFRDHHADPVCRCFQTDCSIWPELKEAGEEACYRKIFRRFDDVNYITDSGSPEWFKDQIDYNPELDFVNLIQYKHPMNWIDSRKRRGEITEDQTGFHEYMGFYAEALFLALKSDQTVFVQTEQLTADPSRVLKKTCDRIGLDYQPEQEKFWTSTHHSLFGSLSAVMHLPEKDNPHFQRIMEDLSSRRKDEDFYRENYRNIYQRDKQDTPPVISDGLMSSFYSLLTNIADHGDFPSENSAIEDDLREFIDGFSWVRVEKSTKQDEADRLARIYIRLSQLLEGNEREALLDLIENPPGFSSGTGPRSWCRIMGRALEEAGETEEALDFFRRALEFEDNDEYAIGDFHHVKEIGSGKLATRAQEEYLRLKKTSST